MTHRTLLSAALLATAVAALLGASPAARGAVTDEQIAAAIQSGVDKLLEMQTDKGWWSDDGEAMGNYSYAGGDEVCAMLALAYAGVPMSNEKMAKGFDALLKFDMYRTYNVGFRIMVIQKLLPHLDRERRELAMATLKADTALLLKMQHAEGGWGYPVNNIKADPARIVPPTGGWDFSNSQMALLGIEEAIHAGLELPLEPLKRAQDLYIARQFPDGGWSYGAAGVQNVRMHSYGSMSAAAVASLFITRDYLYRGMGCPCRGGKSGRRPAQVDQAIERGLGWLGKHFSVEHHPAVVPDDAQLDSLMIYWLYACQRAGLASGIKYFGTHDWYAEGAEFIVRRQHQDHTWGRLHTTMFAICFLVKGRAPILFNKLQFKGDWDMHPRDIANLVSVIAHKKEQPLQWQIINLHAPVDEWHDAPILYISAESALALSGEEKKKLREFTDTGGTILFEASCGNPAAKRSWETLCKELWSEFELRKLDKDDPLWTAEQKITGRLPMLEGMSDGIRTFMFVSWSDISCTWNTMAINKGPLFDLGNNLYVYATDRRPLRARLATKRVVENNAYLNATVRPGPQSALTITRVKHGGDWYVGRNYGLPARLAADLGEKSGLKVKTGEPAAPSALKADKGAVAWLTGRQSVVLADEERTALKAFLAGGGFLLVEAALGDVRFDAEFRKMASEMGLGMKPIAADDPIVTGAMDAATGYDTTSVHFTFALKPQRIGRPQPELFAVLLDGKPVGVYSPFDLSYSQTDMDAFDCRGYAAEDARAILTNILLAASAH